MNDDPKPLTDAQRARFLQEAEQTGRLQEVVYTLRHALTLAEQALVTESWRFQNADVAKEVPAEVTPEPEAISETATIVVRDSRGEIFAVRNGGLVCGRQDLAPQEPFVFWLVDDGRILHKKHAWFEDGRWWIA